MAKAQNKNMKISEWQQAWENSLNHPNATDKNRKVPATTESSVTAERW